MESSITRALFLVKKKKKTNEEVSVCGLLVRFTSCHFYRSGGPDSIQKGSLNLLQMTSAVGRRAGEKNRSTSGQYRPAIYMQWNVEWLLFLSE